MNKNQMCVNTNIEVKILQYVSFIYSIIQS